MDIPYLEGTLIFLTLVFSWEYYLQLRQHAKFLDKNIPVAIQGVITQEVFEKARVYGRDKSWFTLFNKAFSHFETMIFIYLGGLPLMWRAAGHILEHFGLIHTDFEVLHSITFLYLTSVYILITQLPWNLYYTFVLEEKHGFNKQTLKFYVMDQIKSFGLTLALIGLIVPPLIYIVKWGGDHFYLYAWFFVLLISLLAVTVYQDYIAPLFDKFEPLKDCELKHKIEALATSIEFPLGQLLVVNASMRSSHSNAYFYGFFKNKKIVLFDTLLNDDYAGKEKDDKESEPTPVKKHESCTDDEILAILSHELGHWKLNHPLQNFMIGQINVFTSFMLYGMFMHNQQVFEAFGFTTQPVIIGLWLILQYILAPIDFCLNYLITKLTRFYEYQADAYAFGLGYASQLESALIKLQI
eukprot:Ihof_evm3s212 gene=Ihof_evmTU3s212